MIPDVRKAVFGISDQFCTNQPVQSQKITRSLKFWIWAEEEWYYPSSKNKGVDQLCSYCTADLRLCFLIGNNPVFSRRDSCDIVVVSKLDVPELNK